MAETIEPDGVFEFLADQKFWDIFSTEGVNDQPPDSADAVRRKFLETHLLVWSSAAIVSLRSGQGLQASEPGPARETLRLLLEALSLAIDTLLVFKRNGLEAEIPDRFLTSAAALFGIAEGSGLLARGRTVADLSRRLSAARATTRTGVRPVTVDDFGRVHELIGARVYDFEPEKVIRAEDDLAGLATRANPVLRRAENSDGL